jgi:hypothetical protein
MFLYKNLPSIVFKDFARLCKMLLLSQSPRLLKKNAKKGVTFSFQKWRNCLLPFLKKGEILFRKAAFFRALYGNAFNFKKKIISDVGKILELILVAWVLASLNF